MVCPNESSPRIHPFARHYRIRFVRGQNEAITGIWSVDIGGAIRHARYCARVWTTGFDYFVVSAEAPL